MDPNLTTHYLAIETERARLPQQAERGWLVEQARTMQAKRGRALAVRRRIGGLLVITGQRLQGLPESAISSLDSAPAR
jgi:hypothetical protein